MNPSSKLAGKWARLRRRALAVLLLPVGGLLAYVACTLCDANFHVVVAGQAYRSGQMSAAQFTHVIETYGIKSILNLRGENPTTAWHKAEIQTAAKWHVAHYDFGFGSGDELTFAKMNCLVTLMRHAPRPILIHCLGGADRSGLAASLYCYAIADEKPEVAHNQLSFWDGHVPLVRPKVTAMDDSFWRYVINHNTRAKPCQPVTNTVVKLLEFGRSS